MLPIIQTAHNYGIEVITCDYLPNNHAHQFSDAYENVSVVDKEAVLEVAKKHNINGICSFACDAGAISAAYVAEKMNLPYVGSYESVRILQDKVKFREFLRENGFNVPKSYGVTSVDEAQSIDISFPVIVKPADSAGSKGVTKVENAEDLAQAVEYALNYSISKKVIVEEFIEQKGFASDCDCFSLDGDLKFVSFNSQWFDKNALNPYTPIGFSWPSEMSLEAQKALKCELQRLITLLNLRTGIYNVETREAHDGKAYIMEMSPRGGGNRLAEMVHNVYGVDLIDAVVKSSLGINIGELKSQNSEGVWSEIILHSNKDGKFNSLSITQEVENTFLVEKDVWVKKGEEVHLMQGGHHTIGTLVLRFPDYSTMKSYMNNVENWLTIYVDERKSI